MLNPCDPCCCPGVPCEHCRFGYRSAESNHNLMKDLIIAIEAGEKPVGWKAAETYMTFHRNWREELGAPDVDKLKERLNEKKKRLSPDDTKALLQRIADKYELRVVEKSHLEELNPYIVKLKEAIRKVYKSNIVDNRSYYRIAEYCDREDKFVDSVDFMGRANGLLEANTRIYKVLEELDMEDILEGLL